MNPIQYKVTCNVCGEEGVTHIRHAGEDYLEGSFFSHKDPRVCAENLRLRSEKQANSHESIQNT